jgi:ferredoxin-NADP reductase/uncharacterized protein YcbX
LVTPSESIDETLGGEAEVPYLARIFIYPVKSLGAVEVNSARVLPSGALADDRRFAILDAQGKYVNGKRNARVHLLRSAYDSATRNLRLSTGAGNQFRAFNVDSERAALEQWLGEFFGFEVSFRENTSAGFPDDTDSPGPTLISSATLREVAGWFGITVEQTRARFRANLEVDGVPAFWEDQLYGQRGTTVRFTVGDCLFDGVNPCQRCVVPTRDPLTGMDLPEFAKRFVELRRARLPKWAEPSRFNHFYRLAVNTKLVGYQPALDLTIGDRVNVIGSCGVPEVSAKSQAAHAPPKRWAGSLRVAAVFDNTSTVRTFRLSSIDGGKLPFAFLPGQFLNIELTIGGVVHRRCYTIASSPTCQDYCELTIKRNEAGIVSRHLHDHVREGTQIHAAGPGGKFTFIGDEADALVLIGAGVGITPLMSVIRHLVHRKWPGEIDLIYAARTERDIIFREELELLAKTNSNFRLTTTLTGEAGDNWSGPRGRINAELLRRALPNAIRRRVHVCGPVDMANDVIRMLEEAGVPADQIRTEAFGGPAPKPTPAVIAGKTVPTIGTVTFAESGKSVPFHSGQTVLDVATASGIAIDRGCLAGVCGRCKVRVLSGNVAMEECEALSHSERESGFILACQSKPLGSIAIEA